MAFYGFRKILKILEKGEQPPALKSGRPPLLVAESGFFHATTALDDIDLEATDDFAEILLVELGDFHLAQFIIVFQRLDLCMLFHGTSPYVKIKPDMSLT